MTEKGSEASKIITSHQSCMIKDLTSNVPAYQCNVASIGIHALISDRFGNYGDSGSSSSDRTKLVYHSKRSGHTSERGVRIHSCIQHSLVCSKIYKEEIDDSTKRCIYCDHSIRCRLPKCKHYHKLISFRLSELNLKPLCVEFPINWWRFFEKSGKKRICESRIDLLCASLKNDDKYSIISIKTCSISPDLDIDHHRDDKKLNIPHIPFLEENSEKFDSHLVDNQKNRNQIQLMLESVILRDTYGLNVDSAYILYLIDSKESKKKNSKLISNGSTFVKVYDAHLWWKRHILTPEVVKERTFDYICEHVTGEIKK